MDSTLFEKPFGFDAYMEERLLSIENLEERAFARQFLVECLRQVMRESEQSYKELETRIYSEIEPMQDKHYVYMTVVDREKYDITNGAWFPVIENDEAPIYEQEELAETVMDCVFFDGDGSLMEQLIAVQTFAGTVQTKSGTYPAHFRINPAGRYTEKIAQLYTLFQANKLRWHTINAGYLFRFFDVELVEIEGLSEKETIIDYTITFEQFGEHLQKNHIPVWNIQKIYYNSQQFTIPAIDTKYYEHTFPAEVFGIEHGYLLEMNDAITSLRQTQTEILVMTMEETFQKWVAYQVIYKPSVSLDIFRFPVLHNVMQDSFVARYMDKNKSALQSKLEIIRQIEQHDLLGIIRLQDVSLVWESADTFHPRHMSVMGAVRENRKNKEYLKLQHYNWFLQDDFINRNEQKVLLLHFVSERPHFLHYDLIGFLVSQLQQHFGEYRCEAVLHIESGAI